MPKTQYSQPLRDYVLGLARYVRDVTGHTEYRIDISFQEECHEDDPELSGWSCYATVNVNHVYLAVDMRIYPGVAKDYKSKSYSEIGKGILHEVCHIFLEPVTDLFMWDVPSSQEKYTRDTIERQTQRICNAIWANLPDGWYAPDRIKKYVESVS